MLSVLLSVSGFRCSSGCETIVLSSTTLIGEGEAVPFGMVSELVGEGFDKEAGIGTADNARGVNGDATGFSRFSCDDRSKVVRNSQRYCKSIALWQLLLYLILSHGGQVCLRCSVGSRIIIAARAVVAVSFCTTIHLTCILRVVLLCGLGSVL